MAILLKLWNGEQIVQISISLNTYVLGRRLLERQSIKTVHQLLEERFFQEWEQILSAT